MIEPETFRERIMAALDLASSPASQLNYARNVPIADVVAEVFAIWADVYHPSVPTFTVAFNPAERTALAEYAAILDGLSGSAAGLTLPEFQTSPGARQLARAATRTLTVLGAKP